MSKNTKYVVIAPHPDDEIIGCYMQFYNENVKKVVYVDRLDDNRKRESEHFCSVFNVKSCFLYGWDQELYKLNKDDNYLIPSPYDNQELHKLTYHIMKRYFSNISIYSVYMNDLFLQELNSEFSEEKKNCLDKYYPSQKSLWETEHKYFMYEMLLKVQNVYE